MFVLINDKPNDIARWDASCIMYKHKPKGRVFMQYQTKHLRVNFFIVLTNYDPCPKSWAGVYNAVISIIGGLIS